MSNLVPLGQQQLPGFLLSILVSGTALAADVGRKTAASAVPLRELLLAKSSVKDEGFRSRRNRISSFCNGRYVKQKENREILESGLDELGSDRENPIIDNESQLRFW